MRGLNLALTGLALSACLMRQEVGFQRDLPDASCGPTCDSGPPVDAPVHEDVARLIGDLSMGPWVGEAMSGSMRLAVSFEFQKDGDYTARCLDERQAWLCLGLFLAVEDGTVRGQYGLYADNLHGTYHGWFEDPLPGAMAHSDLSELTLEADTLRFTRRAPSVSLGPDGGTLGSFVLVDALVVLKRMP